MHEKRTDQYHPNGSFVARTFLFKNRDHSWLFGEILEDLLGRLEGWAAARIGRAVGREYLVDKRARDNFERPAMIAIGTPGPKLYIPRSCVA
jgi:hypothetical protein